MSLPFFNGFDWEAGDTCALACMLYDGVYAPYVKQMNRTHTCITACMYLHSFESFLLSSSASHVYLNK